MLENNKNAYAGMNVETLIQNTIVDHPSIIKKLQEYFNIEGAFSNTSGGGIYGDKSDVRINFASGHYIDANIKSFKSKVAFNQLARTSVSKFCSDFGLTPSDKEDLEDIIVSKSKNTKNPLFLEEHYEKWGKFFKDNAKNILKWGFSKNPNREILVLYNRDTSLVKIYPMKEVLRCLPTNLTFTKGGFNLGDCISFQRKGGNGSMSKTIPKTSIKHPGNNIQLKLKINKFIEYLEHIKLGEYKI